MYLDNLMQLDKPVLNLLITFVASSRMRLLVAFVPAFLLGACINTSTIDVVTQEPAEVEERSVLDEDGVPLPPSTSLTVETLPNGQPASPVVASLVTAADTEQQAGNWEAAASSLERALRIEPRNAKLWSQLAEVRFEQQDWQQAVQMAAKSNTLLSGNQQLRRRNWFLMVNAYQSMGDYDAAQRFRDMLLVPQ